MTRTAEETGGIMKKVVAEIRYDEDGRKVKRVETATDKCSGRDMEKKEQRKWSDGK